MGELEIDSGAAKKKYDPSNRGPIKNRGCTDVICCILFCLYMVGMLIIGAIAYVEGDPKRLLFPTDSDGKVCGVDIKGKDFLYFFDMTRCLTKGTTNPIQYVKNGLSCPTPQICVEKCPDYNGLGFSVDHKEMICVKGVTVTNITTITEKAKLVRDEKCAPYYIKSRPVFRRCLPKLLASEIDLLKLKDAQSNNVTGKQIAASEVALAKLLNFKNVGMQIFDELRSVWYWLVVFLIVSVLYFIRNASGFVASMVLSLVFIILARWITFPLVIITSLGLLGLFAYGMYYCFNKFKELKDSGSSKDVVWKFTANLENFTQSKDTWLVLGIILIVIFIILFLIMLFLIPRVRIACALIAEASRAVCSMLSTLFFPVIPWLLQLVWFAWFIAVLLYLISNGTKEYRTENDDTVYNITKDTKCDPVNFAKKYPSSSTMCMFSKYVENKHLLRLQVVHFFGWLWGANFIIALSECTLAGAFASYYWAFDKSKDIPMFPVITSFGRTISNHVGSLALGAAIIAIVQLIRVTLEYIHKKLKENTDNPVATFIMKCLSCCFWCLEKCLRFLNKNAYIMIAIYGKNFCRSAAEAFSLMARNPVRLVTINGVTSFLLFLGKLLVVGCVGVASFYWFQKHNANQPDKLMYTAVPIVICVVGSYLVAAVFFSVYDAGIDTLFLSFLEDLERNDGSPEKPYFMTNTLKKIMGVSNKPTETSPLNEENRT